MTTNEEEIFSSLYWKLQLIRNQHTIKPIYLNWTTVLKQVFNIKIALDIMLIANKSIAIKYHYLWDYFKIAKVFAIGYLACFIMIFCFLTV